jgi:hypothetical protein
MDGRFYIEIICKQKNHSEARVCGDVFYSRKIREEGRIIAVLSDGMGHGIKANILATLTSTLALNLTQEHKSVAAIASTIMNTLPVDSVKEMNYSTFTIADIDVDGEVKILEYENPRTLIFRGIRPYDPAWNGVVLEGVRHAGREVLTTSFRPVKEDRIIICSDGVVQSGLGSEKYPVGYGLENLKQLVADAIQEEHDISADRLASRVIDRANLNDGFHPRDDISCAVIYYREPRKLMICSGPPVDPSNDPLFASILRDFNGRKIISGATTADMIAREWGSSITDTQVMTDPDLPPVSHMEGVELITEGILTLSKASELLKKYSSADDAGKGPADQIIRAMLESDEINFLVGTHINPANQDPSLPVELELRRTVVHRIARTLDEKFMKEVTMKFY